MRTPSFADWVFHGTPCVFRPGFSDRKACVGAWPWEVTGNCVFVCGCLVGTSSSGGRWTLREDFPSRGLILNIPAKLASSPKNPNTTSSFPTALKKNAIPMDAIARVTRKSATNLSCPVCAAIYLIASFGT
jgi:hypothetical protein